MTAVSSNLRWIYIRKLRHLCCKANQLNRVSLTTSVKRSFCETQRVSSALEQCVGNTPLLYLKSASRRAGCNIYGKAEFMNPGGSVKDRPALYVDNFTTF